MDLFLILFGALKKKTNAQRKNVELGRAAESALACVSCLAVSPTHTFAIALVQPGRMVPLRLVGGPPVLVPLPFG